MQHNCGTSGTCAEPPEMPLHVASWQYGVVALSVLSGDTLVIGSRNRLVTDALRIAMLATIVVLVLVHNRLRLRRYREIREYYDEQMW